MANMRPKTLIELDSEGFLNALEDEQRGPIADNTVFVTGTWYNQPEDKQIKANWHGAHFRVHFETSSYIYVYNSRSLYPRFETLMEAQKLLTHLNQLNKRLDMLCEQKDLHLLHVKDITPAVGA